MNHFDSWLGSATVQALGWTLIHFIWQGALLALLLPLILGLLRTANARYAVALGTLAAMGAAPMMTFLVVFQAPGSRVPVPAAHSVLQSVSNAALARVLSASQQMSSSWLSVNWLRLAVLLWFIGIVVLSLRTLCGWFVMERLRRRQAQLTGSLRVLCLELQQRMGIQRTVSYCQSYLVDAPSVIGWLRPVVLLPASALTGLAPSQIEAIIVHELAHIRRLDAFVNLFQIAVETVLFYHPGVWFVSRRIRVERENCCDDLAVSFCGNPLDYAKALTLMETWRTAPALALGANGGSLKTRISRLLGLQTFATGVPRGGLAVLALVLSAGVLVAGARFTGSLDETQGYNEASYCSNETAIDPPAPPTPPIPSAAPVPAMPPAPPDMPNAPVAPEVAMAQPAPVPEPQQPPVPPAPPPPPASSVDHSSYIEGMAAAGFTNLNVDDLIALKIQGVTPDYVRDMRASGLNFSRSQLIEMKIQGVTPEYARHIRETWKDATAHELIAMRIQGVEPGDVGQFRQLGISDLSVHDLIEMKIQGVTPEYARHIRETWKDATVHELIAMRIQGVEPGDVGQFRQLGISDLSVHDLIEMKIQGVTPEYARHIRETWKDATVHELIAMRIQGVEPGDVGQFRQLGLPDVSLHQMIEMKIQGVTPDYVRQMKEAGFDGSTHEFVNAKIMGLTPEFVRTVRSHGFKDLDAHKLIELKLAGVF